MGFERCHPAVNLIYFTAVLAGAALFRHPVFLAISFLCACGYCVKRNGPKAILFLLCWIPTVAAFALYYSSFHHFGVTVLKQNLVGNNMTLESLIYGIVLGISFASICIWFSYIFSVFTTDKVVYLFGKISPRLSLFLAITLRMVPRIKKEARRINMAQQGIGRGINQGNLWNRLCSTVRIFSMLITWTIESIVTASESMGSRGSSLRGRAAFSIYRFDNRDRSLVIGIFTCLTVTLMAVLLGFTDMSYDPRILWEPVTWLNLPFYVGYTALCLIPLGLEVWTEYCFQKARKSL